MVLGDGGDGVSDFDSDADKTLDLVERYARAAYAVADQRSTGDIRALVDAEADARMLAFQAVIDLAMRANGEPA